MNFNSTACIEPLEARIAPATIIVTTLADHGTGSLRDALMTADNASGASTIIFQAIGKMTPLKGTIKLASDLPAITNDVTITAPGITINGAGKFEGLMITGGDTISISGIKITNGVAQHGGGLYVNDSGATITLTSCVISGNHAVGARGTAGLPGYAGFGGGIANMAGSVTIVNSKIIGNSATGGTGASGGYAGGGANGGGIYNAGMLTIEHSVVEGNLAHGGAGTTGANYAPYSAKTMTTTMATAGGDGGYAYGGGISTADGSVLIEGSVISKNKATAGSGGAGGKTSAGVNGKGFYVKNGTAYAPGYGTDGGNGYNGGAGGAALGAGISSHGGPLTMMTSTVAGNIATSGTGGKASAGGNGGNGGHGGMTTGANGVSYPAGAGGNGGNGGNGGYGGLSAGAGIYCNYNLNVQTSTISGNVAKAGHAGLAGAAGHAGTGYNGGGIKGAAGYAGLAQGSRGGGIDSQNGILALSEVTIAKNSAMHGGGVSAYQDISALINNSTIAFNTASVAGGGVSVTLDPSNDPVKMVSTIIAQNAAKANADVEGTISSTADLIGGNAMLGKFGFHDGGSTETFLPSPSSPAVVGGPGANPYGLMTDQNGKPFGSSIFIGSVQTTS